MPGAGVVTSISPRLRKALMRQRHEMFAEAEGDYLAWECEALRLATPPDDSGLAKAAIRSIWIDWAGELPDDWRDQILTMVEAGVTTLAASIANERGRAPWINDKMLQRTIVVLQRRSLLHISPRKAVKALCRIESLVHQGVRQ